MSAKNIIEQSGGVLAPLSVRVTPELKDKLAAFRKITGKRPSEVVALALNEFFDGADLSGAGSVEIDDEELFN